MGPTGRRPDVVGDRRPTIAESAVATGRGDDGTTGLLFGGPRIDKDDPAAEAYGSVDEAVAALGLARAELAAKDVGGLLVPGMAGMGELILRLQRELFVVGAELAANPAAGEKLRDGITRVDEAMLAGLESTLAELERHTATPNEFIVPGETRLSAALELARTITRRAERRAVTLSRAGRLSGQWLLPYLNRLADLLWILARTAEQAEAHAATPARTAPRPTRRAR